MYICLRCQKGGQPTSSVYIITPHAHLCQKKKNIIKIVEHKAIRGGRNCSREQKNGIQGAHMSTGRPYPWASSYMDTLRTSGARYPGVPHKSWSSSSWSMTVANPKSDNLTLKLSSSRMFSGCAKRKLISDRGRRMIHSCAGNKTTSEKS
jgi:hypothetical protein